MNIEKNNRKNKTDKIAKSLKNAKWFIRIGIFICIVAPLIATQKAFLEPFDFTQTGQIGDTIGGITAPIVNIIGAILVFYALKAQIEANRLIQDQFDDQKEEELNRKKLVYITEQVNIIRADLNDFTFSYRKDNYKYNYSGADGIYEFLKSIKNGGNHHENYQVFLNRNPKINELVNLLKIINKQIDIIELENISETDKDYFLSLIKYQYDSKIQQSIKAFKEHKLSDQNTCGGCNQKHGIPDEIFNESERIVTKLKE
ncbi:hypothetical protein [Tenacibaculum finnmarkense]|uniref:hypothetical protein n=1 Tax=Tenacibaculum finnmarkense TaxID=2781243 RepID=UPI001E5A2B65|nr:hypothetical protein [Tenacibaculum finnmarkense]MCD8413615.1 hypothetical protein [Tenacibaculum finnmarkense genomovar ulcerans]MCG8208468.1 hypothetical protein [Tenacibaculum finnmarkense genomovar finnmarkense]MCG8724420.1 hypothetical protein [Tenacibaculum finnmarkense]MCG8742738.1 hypothetical protein [Tenacibaculum finnmarkense]MCG8766147.1 hypothetical protein [Tenacibaculum finnmarkense]